MECVIEEGRGGLPVRVTESIECFCELEVIIGGEDEGRARVEAGDGLVANGEEGKESWGDGPWAVATFKSGCLLTAAPDEPMKLESDVPADFEEEGGGSSVNDERLPGPGGSGKVGVTLPFSAKERI